MAESHIIVQVAMHRKGGLPKDDVVNTWHFQAESISPGVTADSLRDDKLDGCLDRVEAFYDELAVMWSAALDGTATIKVYDFKDSEPRVPRDTRETTFGTLADAMPSEVALCLSMQASIGSGDNPRRRRGRVYLGPFGRNLSTYTSNDNDGRPATSQTAAIITAAESLAVPDTSDGFKLAVFSPTTMVTGGTATEAWNVAKKLWVDDAWDIVRKRGAEAKARSSVDVNP